ncbi:MAG: hypothetical protein KDK34_11295 [Leptospiraceae bacterium]|nr:hypothetical protein [Leptospiraceae bacterium]
MKRDHLRTNGSLYFRICLVPICLTLCFCLVVWSCTPDGAVSDSAETAEQIAAQPFRQMAIYNFQPDSEPWTRTGDIPSATLQYLKELDGRPDYRARSFQTSERAQLKQAMQDLPPLLQRALKERLLGIYIVPDFLTSAMTEFVPGSDGKVYAFMILNDSVFKYTSPEIITLREQTVFRDTDPEFEIRIEAGGNTPAVHYIFLHEMVHVADYAYRITPYIEKAADSFQPTNPDRPHIVDAYWRDDSHPEDRWHFPDQDRVTFYGFHDGPLLDESDAPGIYASLARSPYISLYGSILWAEDLAELISLGVLARQGYAYEIQLVRNGKVEERIRPLESPLIQKRLENLRYFYEPDAMRMIYD